MRHIFSTVFNRNKLGLEKDVYQRFLDKVCRVVLYSIVAMFFLGLIIPAIEQYDIFVVLTGLLVIVLVLLGSFIARMMQTRVADWSNIFVAALFIVTIVTHIRQFESWGLVFPYINLPS